jgi:hypothetical protein
VGAEEAKKESSTRPRAGFIGARGGGREPGVEAVAVATV